MTAKPLPEKLFDRYVVKEILGSGGMAVVYLAYDPRLDVNVAVKMLHQAGTPESILRFRNEAIATGRLKHKNIATTLDFGSSDGVVYMVMEYVKGITLSHLIKKQGRLSCEEAIPFFLDICHGLAHAHEHGILHRDLKPSNVVVTDDSENNAYAKILDFGVARMEGVDQGLTLGVGIGSPLYMSPEQASGQEIDVRSDIYSLGCLMFETLTGKLPITGDTASDTAWKKCMEKAPSLASFQELEFPAVMVEIVDQCLLQNRDERFDTVGDLTARLREAESMLDAAKKNQIRSGASQEASEDKKPDVRRQTVLAMVLILVGALAIYFTYSKLRPDYQPKVSLSVPGDSPISKLVGTIDEHHLKALKFSDSYEPLPANIEDDSTRGFFKRVEGNGIELYTTAKDDDLKQLLKLKGLDGIRSENAVSISKTGMKYISAIPLKFLYLNRSSIGNEGLQYISRIKTLEHLHLCLDEKITDDGIHYLTALPKLNKLILGSENLTDKALAPVSKMKNLHWFSISKSRITDAGLTYLNQLPDLVEIWLFDNPLLTPNGLTELLKHQKKVNRLRLDGLKLDVETFKVMKNLPLTYLSLEGQSVTNEEAEILSSYPKLGELHVDCHAMDERGIAALQKASKLKTLVLLDVKMNKEMFHAISRLNVEYLVICDTQLFDSQLDVFLGMKNLRGLKVHEIKDGQLSRKKLDKIAEAYERKYKRRLDVQLEEGM